MHRSVHLVLRCVVCLLSAFGLAQGVAADTLTFSTLAGLPGAVATSIDATGSAAQFSAPRGIAVDSSGNVYVADSSNHTVRKVTAAGVVTTLAGTAGTTGTAQSTPAKFHEPFGVATDSAGKDGLLRGGSLVISKYNAWTIE